MNANIFHKRALNYKPPYIASCIYKVFSFVKREKTPPNAVVAWLALLFRIREVQGSYLVPKTGYPEMFRGFSQYLQENAGIVS
jgi:hypothetical protein